ncbi:LTA synthase family protein [Jeotgalibaca sp. A127]|uniref:LTA synthase family protein n=1 Tax=Jeotgalibaca sp. A127 TaxID=3457324 RepID=UPI003FD0D55F
MSLFQKIKETIRENFGFLSIAVVLFWLKTYLAYNIEFSLGVEGVYQHFLLLINPIASTLFIFGLSLFFSNSKSRYRALLVLYFLNSLLLFSNILYYREFSDFITVKTIMGSSAMMNGLGPGVFEMFSWHDIFYWVDFFAVTYLYRKKRSILTQEPQIKKRLAVGTLVTALLIFFANLSLAEIDRPQLLTRTFDRNYIVKYLGVNVYTLYDGVQTAKANSVRASADSSDMAPVLDYVDSHFASPNPATFGQAEGRNVVYIHLESMQQFLIDLEMREESGEVSAVTPFLNELYHSADSYSFSNFFHQTAQGKTSDAELLLDNSLFGLPQGSAFTQLGSDNTFQAGPQILKSLGYSSAVFHGNVGSFWDRDNVYKSMGYDYFFSSETSYTLTPENSLEYGLKDKLFFQESVQYLEQMEQPFYSKFITVSNHFPFPADEMNTVFDIPDTSDDTINGYFNTVHYADEALAEFFQYMKDSGLYDNTVFVLYGDHFGISNSRNRTLAPLIGRNPNLWGDYHNAMVQRVPFIVHVPGIGTGGINDTYGGQVDVLPTVLHLLGIDTKSHIQVGQDLLSKERDDVVVFRNGNVITPEYVSLGTNVYETVTGRNIFVDEELTPELYNEIAAIREAGQQQLYISDQILNGDLLRFYTPANFERVDKSQISYLNSPFQLQADLAEMGIKSTSLISEKDNVSTVPLYQTDAPEFPGNQLVDEPLAESRENEAAAEDTKQQN